MLKAGFARVDVTPPLGSYIPGYFADRYAKGVLDPLQLNAIALFDGKTTNLIVTSDFLGVDRKYCEKIRNKIAERIKIDTAHIMLSALHQHTSIYVGNRKEQETHGFAYMEMLYSRYCDVAQMALDDMSDATLGFAMEETAEPIAFIRRYLMTDGTIIGHPFGRQSEIVRRLGDADNRVRLLRFFREGKKDIAFVNFCTHPDVIGGEYISADWPGFVRRYVEKDIENVFCILLNGVQGDSNHNDYIGGRRHGYEHSARMGRIIADVVVKIWERTAPQTDVSLGYGVRDVVLPTRTDGMERYEECKALLKATFEGSIPRPSGAQLGDANRVVGLRTAPAFQQLPVTVMRLGQICIVGFGGEPFTHYGTAVEEACPELTVLTSCLCNGGEGYLPTPEIFAEGGYEASSSPYPTCLEEECIKTAMDLIGELYRV
ncbi:MAG: hypothetical protein IJW50_10355 [Clostridia bacterium]|nr:hypothetical protein [Clostridia bacterium]